MFVIMGITYRNSLVTDVSSIYQNLYNDILSLLQGIFSILNHAGLYAAGCSLSFLAAMFMMFGKEARMVAELKEDLREKIIVIACLGGIVNIVGLIITLSSEAGIGI